jgi:hypothetical protein
LRFTGTGFAHDAERFARRRLKLRSLTAVTSPSGVLKVTRRSFTSSSRPLCSAPAAPLPFQSWS